MIEMNQENETLEKNEQKEVEAVETEDVQKKNEIDKENDVKSELDDEFSKVENMLKEEIDKLDDKLKRTMAEFDNFRKRTVKEKSSMYDDGVKTAIEKILPVLDNLERALLAADNTEGIEILDKPDTNSGLHQGLEMTLRQFIEILNALGVKEIEAQGKEFDPKYHMAVAHVEDEGYESNTVIEVLQKGYMYKDKIVRYSTVKVAN